MKRWSTIVALVAASALGMWQLGPMPSVAAGPSVDQKISAVAAAPASFADVIEAVQPAVVNISISGPARMPSPGHGPMPPGTPGYDSFEDFLRRFFERQNFTADGPTPMVQGMGSGFIVDPEGYVVTNNHVIERASAITVTLNDGTRLDAELVGTDPKTDLAVVKVESDEPLPYAQFGDSTTTRVGDWVVAIGSPFGLGSSATAGIVSARGRDIQSGPFDDFLQIDAPINRGNSGGPLFDLNGHVVGINTAIFSPNGGNVGIGFAISSELAKPIIEQLKTTGRVERGWLGVTIQPMNEELAEGFGFDGDSGALVASVVADSPADEAGLLPGDVIVGIDGDEVDTLKELTRRVAAIQPNETAELEIWRDGTRKSVQVSIGEAPTEVADTLTESRESKPRLGLTLGELTVEARQQFRIGEHVEGALITNVDPRSPAAMKGLRTGDVIVMVGQSEVTSVEEAVAAIEAASAAGRENVVLRILRGTGDPIDGRFVVVPFA